MKSHKEQIERLKKNEVLFGRLPREDIAFLEAVGPGACSEWGFKSGFQQATFFYKYNLYRIKQDYQCEPPVVRCEVYAKHGNMFYNDNNTTCYLHGAVRKQDFMYYEYEDGRKCVEPRLAVSDGVSGPALTPKYVVFAR